jgi:hypothetical protein
MPSGKPGKFSMCSQFSTWPPEEKRSNSKARQRSRAAKMPAV